LEDKSCQTIYIVTGAAGHLGSAVVDALKKEDKIIYALCLPGEKHPPQGANVKVFFGNVCDIDSISVIFEACVNKPIIVIHCAGIVSIYSQFNKKVFNVNVNGTKNIVALCEKFGVKKLVYISSVHAIPELPTGSVIKEVDHFNPTDVTGLYAKTKSEATQFVLNYTKRGGNACVIHPTGITGPGDFGRGHITQLIKEYCKGTLTSMIDGGYDFVDVRDVADGILLCCEKSRSAECYIMSGQYYKIQDIFKLLHEISGKREIKRILPLWFVKLTAPLSELYYKILNQPPLFTSYSIFTLNTNANFSHEKASKELGYTSRPIKQTLADTIKWLEENMS